MHVLDPYFMYVVDDRLEDDDYELIRENTGIEVSKVQYMATVH